MTTEPVPPLWKRVLLLPFVPSLWSAARHWPLGAVVWPLFLLATLWSGALATWRGLELRSTLATLARDWDAQFDPVVVEHGEVRVEGPRLPRGDENGTLLLVDPEETTPTPSDRPYIIVRKRTVLSDSRAPMDLEQVQKLLGGGTLRIEGQSVLEWLGRWGTTLQLGMLALLVGAEWVGTVLGVLYGLIVGAILVSLFGKSRGVTSEQCTRVGVATMAAKPALGVVLSLTGLSVHACLGIVVWPALGVALGAFALSRLPTVTPPGTPSPG